RTENRCPLLLELLYRYRSVAGVVCSGQVRGDVWMAQRAERSPELRKRHSPTARGNSSPGGLVRTDGKASHLFDHRLERLSVLCRQGGAKGAHEGRGGQNHLLVDGTQPRDARPRTGEADALRGLLRSSAANEPPALSD